MSLRINHNITALDGHRNMVNNDAMVSKSIQRLSSGLRINRAADDAAGLVISEQMRAQIGGLNQAIANSEQAVTMVQTAEGALDEVNSLLSKGRSLAVHAANSGVNDTNQLIADQSELDNIVDSVNRISNNTQFGTKKILDGSLSNATSNNSAVASVALGGDYTKLLTSNSAVPGYHTLRITQQATQATDKLSMAATDVFSAGTLLAAKGSDLIKKSFTLSVNGAQVNVASGTTKNQFVQQLNAIGSKVGFTAATTGASLTASGNVQLTANDYGRSFTFNIQFVSGASGASALAQTKVVGKDSKATLFLYTGKNQVGGTASSGSTKTLAFSASGGTTFPGGIGLTMVSSGGSTIVLTTNVGTGSASNGFIYGAIDGTHSGAVFQVGANVNQTATVQLQSTNASQLGVGGSGSFSSLAQVKGSSLISGQANEVLKVIDKAIDDITNLRGKLGSFQANTLETGLNSLRVTQENLTAAESTIRDVDFAQESSNFTRNNILVQSSTAMLAQANQLPQQVLKLLA
jgi:flagellin